MEMLRWREDVPRLEVQVRENPYRSIRISTIEGTYIQFKIATILISSSGTFTKFTDSHISPLQARVTSGQLIEVFLPR